MKDETVNFIAVSGIIIIPAFLVGLFSGSLITDSMSCQEKENFHCKACDDAPVNTIWLIRILFSLLLPCLLACSAGALHPNDSEKPKQIATKKRLLTGSSAISLFYLFVILGGYLADKFMTPKTHDCEKLALSHMRNDLFLFPLATLMSQSITYSGVRLLNCFRKKLTTQKHERLLDEALRMENYGTQSDPPPNRLPQP